MMKLLSRPWGQFLEGSEKFSHPESHSKISNLMNTELFYSHILNVKRGSLHTRSFRHIHHSVFRYRLTKNGLRARKVSRVVEKRAPGFDSLSAKKAIPRSILDITNAKCLLFCVESLMHVSQIRLMFEMGYLAVSRQRRQSSVVNTQNGPLTYWEVLETKVITSQQFSLHIIGSDSRCSQACFY